MKTTIKIIITVNLVMFFLTILTNYFTVDQFWNDPAVSIYSEPWRLFTSIFIHGDVIHLAVNLLTLLFIGYVSGMSNYLSKGQTFSIFIIAALIGGFGSALWNAYNGSFIPSLGASGGICGLMGAYTYLIGRIQGFKIFFMNLAYILLMSVFFQNTDLACHLYGFLAGFLVTRSLGVLQEI